jgi:hypothetical protein
MPPMTKVTFDTTNTLICIFDSYDDSVINDNLNTPIGVFRLTKRLKSVLKIYF